YVPPDMYVTDSMCAIMSHLPCLSLQRLVFFFNHTATTEIYTLSLHDALPICRLLDVCVCVCVCLCSNRQRTQCAVLRSEEHTSELQSHLNLVCRLLLVKN